MRTKLAHLGYGIWLPMAVMHLTAMACGGPGTSAPQSLPAVASTGMPRTVLPNAERMIDLSRDDLARRRGVADEDIVVQLAEAVLWADTSLECPQPGVVYARIATQGYRIVLDVAGERYVYHTDSRSRVALCQSGRAGGPVPTPPPPGEITDDRPWMPTY